MSTLGGKEFEEGMECITLYTSVLFEFPPMSITLEIKKKKNKFKIP